jgi:copper chaperone
METIKLDVHGMTCYGCVASVKRVLTALPGVDKVEVTLEPGSATVEFDPARTSAASMKSAIEDAGYEVPA